MTVAFLGPDALLPGFSWDELVDPRRVALVWLLGAFLVTAALTRWITRRIRAGQQRRAQRAAADESGQGGGIIKDVHIGGVHVHHQVWGILGALVVGLLLVTYQPTGVWLNVLAALFGASAALALDEFAMWLHLRDVYWSTEGRASISALMTAATICFVLILGSAPLGIEQPAGSEPVPAWAVIVGVLVDLALAVLAVLKGKLRSGLVGIFIPVASAVAAWRLAKPGSWWARRRYAEGSRKAVRAAARFDAAYEARWRRVSDLIGGAPTAVREAKDAGTPDRVP